MTPLRRRRPSADDRLDAELRDHYERYVADLIARGLAEPEARRQARLELGGLEQSKEACRDVRPLRWAGEFARDVRLGLRSLKRDRLFAASVTLILALGIGTTVTMFSVLNAVVLRPLPYTRPDELVLLTTHLIAQNRPDGTSMANFLDWRTQSRAFASMTFYRRTSVSVVTIGAAHAPERVQEGLVGPEFFELIGSGPIAGRVITHDEFNRADPVVVLSETLWRERFGGVTDAIGRTLPVDGRDHLIVGVMPRTFELPTRETRLWRPLSVLPLWPKTTEIRNSDQYEVLGRLHAGVTVEEASAEMRLIAAGLRDAYPAINRNLDVRIIPLFEHVVGWRTGRGLWLGFAAVLCLLVTASANVGGLLSSRAARRQRELAVRVALGAGRGRLVRQLLAETGSLWLIGSAAGLALAFLLIRLLSVYAPRTLPRVEQIAFDAPAVAVAVLLGLVVMLVCGTTPALIAAKLDVTSAFGVRDQSSVLRARHHEWLVAAQIAAALMLVVGAVLFARSFVRASGEDPGYPADKLLIVRLDLPRAGYPDGAAVASFFREAHDRIGRLPGVAAVGAITDFFIRRNADQSVTVEGREAGRQESDPRLATEVVTPGYFRAAGIHLRHGRDFEPRDYEPGAPPVFIVSDSLAQRFWPGEHALGKLMVAGDSPPRDGQWGVVVGVVRDFRRESLDVAPILGAYIPSFPRGMDMTIRTSVPAETLMAAVRQEIRAMDRALPIGRIASADGRLRQRLETRRFESQLLAVFSAIALLLAAAGLYALLAYQVALRRRELGIRSALGADRRAIVRLVLAKGLRLATIGGSIGLIGAVLVASVIQSLLYQTPSLDVLSYGIAAAAVLVVAAIAAGLPALRAARLDPIAVLRE